MFSALFTFTAIATPLITQDTVQISIDASCNVSFVVAGEKQTSEKEKIIKVVRDKLVIEELQVDIDLVKAHLPEVDFSKDIMSWEDGQKVQSAIDELGPWDSIRHIYVSSENKIKCLYDHNKNLLKVEEGKIPYEADVLYTVEST